MLLHPQRRLSRAPSEPACLSCSGTRNRLTVHVRTDTYILSESRCSQSHHGRLQVSVHSSLLCETSLIRRLDWGAAGERAWGVASKPGSQQRGQQGARGVLCRPHTCHSPTCCAGRGAEPPAMSCRRESNISHRFPFCGRVTWEPTKQGPADHHQPLHRRAPSTRETAETAPDRRLKAERAMSECCSFKPLKPLLSHIATQLPFHWWCPLNFKKSGYGRAQNRAMSQVWKTARRSFGGKCMRGDETRGTELGKCKECHLRSAEE